MFFLCDNFFFYVLYIQIENPLWLSSVCGMGVKDTHEIPCAQIDVFWQRETFISHRGVVSCDLTNTHTREKIFCFSADAARRVLDNISSDVWQGRYEEKKHFFEEANVFGILLIQMYICR